MALSSNSTGTAPTHNTDNTNSFTIIPVRKATEVTLLYLIARRYLMGLKLVPDQSYLFRTDGLTRVWFSYRTVATQGTL